MGKKWVRRVRLTFDVGGTEKNLNTSRISWTFDPQPRTLWVLVFQKSWKTRGNIVRCFQCGDFDNFNGQIHLRFLSLSKLCSCRFQGFFLRSWDDEVDNSNGTSKRVSFSALQNLVVTVRNISKYHLKPYRGLETDREANINLLFQELRGGIRIVWKDIHRMFCKITHICSALRHGPYDIHWEKRKLFWQDHSIIAGISIEKSFFFEIKQQLYTSAYCKALDAFWTIMSWALELCLSRWSLLTTTTTGIASLGQSL